MALERVEHGRCLTACTAVLHRLASAASGLLPSVPLCALPTLASWLAIPPAPAFCRAERWLQVLATALPAASTYFIDYSIIHGLCINLFRFVWCVAGLHIL